MFQVNLPGWSRKKGIRLFMCLAVSAAFLYLAVRDMHFDRVLREIQHITPVPIAGAICCLFVSFWIRAYRWHYLLLPTRVIPVYPLFRSVIIGFMGNYLLPLHAGEVMRAVSIGKTQGISKATALGSIVLERAFDGIVLALTPFLLFAVLDLPSWIVGISVASLLVLAVGLLAFVGATRRRWSEGWLKQVMSRLPGGTGGRLGHLGGEFIDGLKGINHTGALMPVVVLSLLCWLLHGMYYFLLFKALDLNLSFWAALILQMVIGVGVILPGAPGYIGNFEYFTILGLGIFGVAQESAFGFALVAHICQFVPVTAVGLLFALRKGFQAGVKEIGRELSLGEGNVKETVDNVVQLNVRG